MIRIPRLLRDRLTKPALWLADAASRHTVWHPGIKVKWFKSWSPELDEALASLPESETCPHEVYKALATNPTAAEKRLALVSSNVRPLAVISLRRRRTFWEPVTEICVPRCVAPAAQGALGIAVRALGLEVRTGGYPHDPHELGAREVQPYEIYRADLTQNFEAHWKAANQMHAIRKARKRTDSFEVRVDCSDDIDWVANAWEKMWKDDPAEETLAVDDLKLSSKIMMKRGLLHTLTLVDSGVPVAGALHVVYNNGLLFQCTARDKTRENQAVGTRILDVSFHWAAEAGYRTIDIGGGGGYKRWWARPAGERYQLVFQPPLMNAVRTTARRIRHALSKNA